jgi:hypothetical protein
MFKSYLEGVLISLRSDNCPMPVRVFHEGSLELSMMNPWAFSSYLDDCGSGQDHSRNLASGQPGGCQGGVFLPTLGLPAHKESLGGHQVSPFLGLAGQLSEFV